MGEPIEIHGHCDPRFVAVQDAFRKNFDPGLEVGASFAAVHDGEPVVDANPRTFFWGGWGGSLVVVDLDAKLGFSYVMNRMSETTLGDTRAFGPAAALWEALA